MDKELRAVLARFSPWGRPAFAKVMSDPRARLALAAPMTPREYIEAVALELGKLRGGGLVLSPADAQLALAWHAAGVPLADVLGEIKRGTRLRSRSAGLGIRGAAEVSISLQALAPGIEATASRRRAQPVRRGAPELGLVAELRRAARVPRLAARAAWEDLADRAEELLLLPGGDLYWTQAIRALLLALRELGSEAARTAGSALRDRLGPRPASMSRRRYQRSLQLQLLSVASECLGVPPRPFLL